MCLSELRVFLDMCPGVGLLDHMVFNFIFSFLTYIDFHSVNVLSFISLEIFNPSIIG